MLEGCSVYHQENFGVLQLGTELWHTCTACEGHMLPSMESAIASSSDSQGNGNQ